MKNGEVKKENLEGLSLDTDPNVPSAEIGYKPIIGEPISMVGGYVFGKSGGFKLKNNSFLGNVYRQIYELRQRGGFND